MNKAALVARVQVLAQLDSIADAERAVDAVLDAIKEGLKNDTYVQVVGFGIFEVRDMKPRIGINPSNRERITIPATRKVVFRAGKALKEDVTAPPKKLAKK